VYLDDRSQDCWGSVYIYTSIHIYIYTYKDAHIYAYIYMRNWIKIFCTQTTDPKIVEDLESLFIAYDDDDSGELEMSEVKELVAQVCACVCYEYICARVFFCMLCCVYFSLVVRFDVCVCVWRFVFRFAFFFW